jgi:hypothetical protein
VLRSNDGIDDGSEIVDIGEGLDAKHNVVESNRTTLCGIFGISDNYAMVSFMSQQDQFCVRSPCRGLNRSLPKVCDLEDKISIC